ncbi:MAG: 2OG-Fe(II) oxygenase [Nostoc sp.]
MLNLSAISNATMQSIPYKWIVFENLLDTSVQSELANSFPTTNYKEYHARDFEPDEYPEYTYNDYRFFARCILDESKYKGLQDIKDLSLSWQKLIEELLTPDYREAMEHLTNLDLKNHSLTVYLTRHDLGFWNRPHTDIPRKHVTHLFYLNEGWNPEWGGHFRILKDNQTTSVVKEVPPLPQYSVALVRCDRSWHMVSPISLNATQHRLHLQTCFWLPES